MFLHFEWNLLKIGLQEFFMKAVLFFLFPLFFVTNASFAEEGKPSQAVPPVEVLKLSDEAGQALFERVRGAHLRAIQKGLIAAVKQ